MLNDMYTYRTKHRSLTYAFTDHHSQLKSLEQHVHKLTETLNEQVDGLINATFKIPQSMSRCFIGVLSLATLLGGGNGLDDLGPANQSPGDDMKKKQEKKRRALRM